MKTDEYNQVEYEIKMFNSDELAQYRASIERSKDKRNATESRQQEAKLIGKLARGEI